MTHWRLSLPPRPVAKHARRPVVDGLVRGGGGQRPVRRQQPWNGDLVLVALPCGFVVESTYQPTNLKYNHWQGIVTYVVQESWPSGFCGSISVTNTGSSPAVSWILSETNLATKGTVTAFWGYVQNNINIDSVSQIYRQIGFGNSIPPNVPTVIGGWCMVTIPTQSYDSNWIANNVRFGIDLYDKTLDCPLEGCAIFCGNGRCDSSAGENITNCPFDCGKILCPNRRMLWSRWFK